MKPNRTDRERAERQAAIAASSPWMTAAEAARFVKRGRQFVLREIREGRLRAARIGGRGEVLTRADWLDAWVEAQSTPVMVVTRRRG